MAYKINSVDFTYIIDYCTHNEIMRKMLLSATSVISFIAIFICSLILVPKGIAIAGTQPIKTVAITDGNIKGTASLLGNGDNYITDLKVRVKFENNAPYDIKLEDGYSPYIETFDFGAQDKLLFCSSQTGGSGGYGNYSVYSVKTDSYKLIYNDKTDSQSTKFEAEFQPYGFMLIKNNSAQSTLRVDVKYMDATFYDMIFAPDGSLTGEQPYVNQISFVSPALNPSDGLYRLITYRSVVAVAEVNRLGYIVQTLSLDKDKFVAEFTEFSIKL